MLQRKDLHHQFFNLEKSGLFKNVEIFGESIQTLYSLPNYAYLIYIIYIKGNAK